MSLQNGYMPRWGAGRSYTGGECKCIWRDLKDATPSACSFVQTQTCACHAAPVRKDMTQHDVELCQPITDGQRGIAKM
jgi:hypothetical protein